MQPHERLRLARERANFVRATDAARAFGWAPSTYLGHENGSRGLNKEAAERYAKAFKVAWEWLLGGSEQPEGQPHGIPVYWEAEYGAYRSLEGFDPAYCDIIPVGVFGYENSQLYAVTLHGVPGYHLICRNPDPTRPVLEYDYVVIHRMDDQNRSEVAIWQVMFDGKGQPVFAPVERSPGETGRKHSLQEMEQALFSVVGVGIASYNVFSVSRALRVVEGLPQGEFG